jgi:allantoinase
MEPDLILRAGRVVTPQGVRAAAVHIRGGQIVAVTDPDAVPEGFAVTDLGDLTLMPGVVDTHVHINEPGRTEWEGFETATRAAAAGGITTVVDMPLNSIPAATSARGVAVKSARTEGRVHVDVGLWGGAVPDNTRADPAGLGKVLDEGALGFKCFLLPSGVDEFPFVTEDDLRAAMLQLRGTGATLMVHAELPGPIDDAARAMAEEDPPPDPRVYRNYVRSRPREAEDRAVALLLRLVRELRVPTHVVHLSSSGALGLMAQARDASLPLTAETAPHYLHFTAEAVPDGATWFKCAPPIRERDNQERLWAGLDDGLISMVVSDHSPCIPDLKHMDTGDFATAWGGIAGLQCSFLAMYTEATRRGFGLDRVVGWMCEAPARHAGLWGRKGAIAAGFDADLVALDPTATTRVDAPFLQHRHKVTPYQGETLQGAVKTTWLRGQVVYDGAEFSAPKGRWIRRRT